MTALAHIAKTIRSKNAGVDLVTFDIIFPDRASFHRVLDSGELNRNTVARLYEVDPSVITDFVVFEPANAVKFTMKRSRPSGSPGDGDVFGAQQYAPLLALDVPDHGSHSQPIPDQQGA